MTLHLIHLPIDLRALHAWGEARGVGKGIFDEGLALHHLLGETFGAAVLQPFRLMVAPRARSGALYAYAAQSAEDLATTAQTIIDPAASAVIAFEQMRSHPRPEASWTRGQRLGFDVRLRPTVRLASPLTVGRETFRKGAEVDAYLAHVARSDDTAERAAVYFDWLAARFAGVAELEADLTRLARYERRRIVRNGRVAEGPDATFHGTLTIDNPAAFAPLLARGVGRHTTYGYGMLMLRPPGKTGQAKTGTAA